MQKHKFIKKEEYKSHWFDSVTNDSDISTSSDDLKMQLN